MYDLNEYSEKYLQTRGSLWQYYRDQPGLNDDGKLIDFPVNNWFSYDTSLSFKYEKNAFCRRENDGPKITGIWVPIKYLNNIRELLKGH